MEGVCIINTTGVDICTRQRLTEFRLV